jgi:two-component system sensor histidine kinase KdpD
VITNLLENALRYAPPAQPVRVTIRNVDGSARVVVADGGPGIPPEDLERVFEKFRRGDARGRGVGLGLTICRAMVEAHGGRIWAQSPLVAGRGAAIHFELPFGQANANLEIA